MCRCEPSLVRTSGRRAGRVRRPRTPKPDISCAIPACRGGGCAAKVPVLTRGRPVDVDHMITTILMTPAEPRGEAMRPGVAGGPVVVVKYSAVDVHGDMDRGQNRVPVQSSPAHGKKVVAAEAKGEHTGRQTAFTNSSWSALAAVRSGMVMSVVTLDGNPFLSFGNNSLFPDLFAQTHNWGA